MESGLADNGPWATLKDFVSKAAENSARLAALFHLFEGKGGDISTEHIESAIEIIRWHMQETRRLLATESSQSEVQDAQKLLNWLMMKDHYTISVREIQRLSPLRDKSRINKAIDILMDHHIIRDTSLLVSNYLPSQFQ